MPWVDPTSPNIADYYAFLANTALTVSAGQTLNSFLPTVSGTATSVSATTLTDSSQTWTANQWVGCTLYDSTANLQVIVTANTTNTLTFASQSNPPVVGDAYVVVQPIVAISLQVAMATVNRALNSANSGLYVLAVYNLATDRLMNFAPDQPNQSYFSQLRDQYHLLDSKVGVVASGSDQGTSGSLVNPEQLSRLTLEDLQMLKTPFGKNYLGMAQAFGPDIFGLS